MSGGMTLPPDTLCASTDLRSGGAGCRLTWFIGTDQPRFCDSLQGRVYAYLNRCAMSPWKWTTRPAAFSTTAALAVVFYPRRGL
jgi:hypothetical protein